MLFTSVHVTATSYQYAGQYGGAFAGNNERYLFSLTFDQDVSASLVNHNLLIDQITGTDPDPIYDQHLYWDASTNTATYAIRASAGILANGNYRAALSKFGITGPTGDTLASDSIIDFKVLAGDANGSAGVDAADFVILSNNFGASPRNFTQGDFNYDATVDAADYVILSNNYGATIPNPPTAPDQVTVGNATTNSLQLTWQDVQPSATGYRIERSTDGETFSIDASIVMSDPSLVRNTDSTTGITNISWNDTAAVDGTRYWYRVRAYGNSLDTAYTPKTAATTPLIAPNGVSATDLTADRISVSWTAGSAQATQYRIYRSLAGASPSWTLVDTTSATSPLTYTDKTAKPGTSYVYYVAAVNPTIVSAPSAISASVTTMTLAQDMNAEISALISGKTASDGSNNTDDTLDIFSTADDTSTTAYPNGHYVRNSKLWAAGIDLTSIPVWNSFWPSRWPGSPPPPNIGSGVLISPTFLLQAAHMNSLEGGGYGSMRPGTEIRFVTNDNQVVVRYLADTNPDDDNPTPEDGYPANSKNGYFIPGTDLYLTPLTQAVPNTIRPAKVFSGDLVSAIGQNFGEVPLAYSNRFRQLHITDLLTPNARYETTTQRPSTGSIFRSWDSGIIAGDSSSPVFSILDGSPVVWGTWHGGSPETGENSPYYFNYVPNVHGYLPQISNIVGALDLYSLQ